MKVGSDLVIKDIRDVVSRLTRVLKDAELIEPKWVQESIKSNIQTSINILSYSVEEELKRIT